MERGSPTPLQTVSPERVNQQPMASFDGHCAAATMTMTTMTATTVSDKIGQFNSLAKQSKQLERKTADAALKRAMVGREEAEVEMRRYRDEARQLRRQVDEGRERERRVGERLEAVMENYGRAKETHAHTQVLWEKEIRRARKETFKSQSAIVKLQEALKTARAQARAADEALAHEQARSRAREQEAFQARYDLVGCQEELAEARQRLVLVEQERDAFKSLAKSVADMGRVASEGRVPLPPPDEQEEEAIAAEDEGEAKAEAEPKADDTKDNDDDDDDDNNNNNNNSNSDRDSIGGEDGNTSPSASLLLPRVRSNNKTLQPPAASPRSGSGSSRRTSRRVSAALLSITSSAASEAEIDELTRLWQWEKQRANRAADLVDFLEAECRLRACACTKKRPRTSLLLSCSSRGAGADSEAAAATAATASASASHRKRPAVLDLGDGGDSMIRSEKHASAAAASPTTPVRTNKLPAAKAIRQSFLRESLSQPSSWDAAEAAQEDTRDDDVDDQATSPQQTPPLRMSTVFVPEEGVFRTVSQQIAEEMEEEAAAGSGTPVQEAALTEAVAEEEEAEEAAAATAAETELRVERTLFQQSFGGEENDNEADTTVGDVTADSAYTVETTTTTTTDTAAADASMYARTPSVEPPSFALLAQQRTSLLSLLNAPHRRDEPEPPLTFHVPTCAAPETLEADASCADVPMEEDAADVSTTDRYGNKDGNDDDDDEDDEDATPQPQARALPEPPQGARLQPYPLPQPNSGHDHADDDDDDDDEYAVDEEEDLDVGDGRYEDDKSVEAMLQMQPMANGFPPRPHTVTGSYRTATKTTTTKVPLREENTDPNLARRLLAAQKQQQQQQKRDAAADAMTPTMTREECLAQIRERRGRTRSTASRSGSGSGSGNGSGRAGESGASPTAACVTPRRPVTPGSERRQVSAPMSRSRGASARRVRT